MITLYIFFVDFIGNALIVLLGPISNTASLAYRCRFCCRFLTVLSFSCFLRYLNIRLHHTHYGIKGNKNLQDGNRLIKKTYKRKIE